MARAQNLSEASSELASLKTFDPSVFVGGQDAPQDVCNLFLALALFYNDLKNALYGYLLLLEHKPEGEPNKTPGFGQYAGMRMHFIRYHMGLVHELCELLKLNQDSLNHPLLKAVVSQMPKGARKAWQAVVDVALDRGATNPFAKTLARIRNKVSHHYDPKEIFDGYKKHFFDGSSQKELAYISLGQNMYQSRFYFADAAGQGYMELRVGEDAAAFFNQAISIMKDVDFAVMCLVHHFILKRGFSYRDHLSDNR